MRRILGLFLGLMAFATPSLAADDLEQELEKLIGSWNIVSMDSGKGAKHLDGFKLLLSRKKMILQAPNGATKHMGEISGVNPSAKPRHIDLRNGGDTGLGIYELEGETLKLIICDPGQKRPSEFQGSAKGMLFILKRDKK